MKKKPKLTRLKVRTKKIESITYSKLSIMWFFQWLKLAIDLEGQTIEVGAKKVWEEVTRKRRRIVGGKGDKVQDTTSKLRTRKQQKGTDYKIKVSGWNTINLNELRRLPKIINMTKNEVFKHFNKWFAKNKHLFEDYSVRYGSNIIESEDYFTVQIPKSLDRKTINNQIDELIKGLKLKKSRKRDITFIRGVQKDVMKKQWEVYKLKTIDNLENSKIAKRLGYKTGTMLKIKGGKTQTQGVRAVQKSFESAKYLIINVSNGIFPKTTL